LSGGRTFNFQVQLPTNPAIPGIPKPPCVGAIVCQTPSQEGYGSNGLAGHIDPFGWAAPKGIDPWAWKSIGKTASVKFPSGLTDFGAFSINLWLPGQAPPTYWTDFVPVYAQGAPGNGIGGYNLQDSVDRVFAFDYDGSGKLDHLILYRPGTGTIWILKNKNGVFTPVYQQGAPGNGIGGYDLLNAVDQVFAFDYDGSGKLDHLVLYRPGTGTIWILKRENSG
jgi:FG-GAP-like repeat